MKFDLHLHSEYSWDSKVKIEDYISIAEQNNFHAISITDHNNIESHAIIDKLQDSTDVLLIPGQEVSTLDGHLLVYGWTDQLPRDLSMIDTVNIARKTSTLCIAAHPFDPFRGGKFSKVFEADIDGLELLNASAWFGFPNWLASRAYSKTASMLGLGNSDSHLLNEFGNAFTLTSASSLPETITRETLLETLSNSMPQGSRIGIRRKFARLIRRL